MAARKIWLYKLEKHGKGWRAPSYVYAENKLPEITGNIHQQSELCNNSIAKLKKHFNGKPNVFTCVLNYDIVAPSDIYQLIIEFESCNDFETVTKSLRAMKNRYVRLEYEILSDISWITDASEVQLKKMLEW
jgi:hypothetical protein